MSEYNRGPFLVIAYRWGWLNNGQYFVALTNDEEKAVAMADAEAEDRGGKYGCTVYYPAPNGSGCGHLAILHHSPSLYGEAKPENNPRIDAFEAVGNRVGRAIEAPSADQPVPDWLKEEYASAIKLQDMISRAINK